MELWDCHCEKRGELGRGEEPAQRESDRKRQRHGGRANRETDTHTHTHELDLQAKERSENTGPSWSGCSEDYPSRPLPPPGGLAAPTHS